MGTIVVGVDGSAGSETALRWALAEARLRAASVRIVHAYQPPHFRLVEAGLAAGMGMPGVLAEDAEQMRRAVETQARNLVEQALGRMDAASVAGLEIEQAAIGGAPVQVLIESAKDAELLVLGSRGHGGFIGLLLGSVSQQCAQQPPCPIVILPPEGDESTADG